MKKKVLVLDIDGTLTNSKKEITPKTRQALLEIQRQGHIVVLAEEHEHRLARRFMGRLAVYRSEPYFIEVMARGVNKADAVAGLLERLEMEREDTIACGDGLNDLTMIKYAGLGVTMGNAQQPVKDAADIVTLSNDEDGLVPVIEKYILGA